MRTPIEGTGHKMTLNGGHVQDVIWADPETGECELYVHCREGNRIPDSDHPNGSQTIRVKGKVAVEVGVAPPIPPNDNPWPPDYSWNGCNAMPYLESPSPPIITDAKLLSVDLCENNLEIVWEVTNGAGKKWREMVISSPW